MQSVFTIPLLLLVVVSSFGQARIEAQFGGSNFLGMTINSAYDIALSKNNNQFISPSFGIGILAPWWDEPTSIIHLGLNYQRQKWGAGVEASSFLANPLWGDGKPGDFVDLIVYPNINYTLSIKSGWYFKISGGAYFAFTRMGNFYVGESNLVFEGDVIPGGGFTVGYKL
jgi:hypothetical protein